MWTFFTRFRFSGRQRTVLSNIKNGPLYRGFTVVELLVVAGIITVLSTVLLFQQRRFDSSTLLRSLAYSVALSVRQAQTYGSSVRQFGATAQSFSYSYGVYFSKNATSYQLFADVNGDTQYSSSPTDEKVQSFTIGRGYTLQTFCGMAGNSMTCSNACPTTNPTGITSCVPETLNWLTIYFKRPNPDALFSASSGGPYAGAYIQILGPAGGAATRAITVTSTGQITVGNLGS